MKSIRTNPASVIRAVKNIVHRKPWDGLMDLLGCAHLPSLGQMGQGGSIFHDKAEKY